MTFDTTAWIFAGLAAVIVGLSKTGVPGLGMLAVAIFANFIPAKQSSGFVLPLLIVGDIVAVASYRHYTDWKHLWKLFPWTASGVVLGWFTMRHIDNRQAQLLIGSIVVVLVSLHLWRKRRAKIVASPAEDAASHGVWFPPTIGILAGFTTLIANAAGPLMAIYLLAMRLPKMTFIGTSAFFFFLLNLFKVLFMVNLGLITIDSFSFNIALAPAVLAGAFLGRWLLPRISQVWFERVALGLSAAAGLKLLLG